MKLNLFRPEGKNRKEIINAQKKYNADCIAMSGLLVKSTAFMKDNLEEFNKDIPTIDLSKGILPK